MTYLTTKFSCWRVGLMIVAIMFVLSVQAAPGTLSQVPLFTSSNNVQPNIFFEVDDSSSMDHEILTVPHWWRCLYNTTITTAGDIRSNDCTTLPNRKTDGYFYSLGKSIEGTFYNYGYIYNTPDNFFYNAASCSTKDQFLSIQCQGGKALDFDWRVFSSDFNVVYYNPNITYLPWQGGTTTMGNASFTAARSNPKATTTSGSDSVRNLGDNGGVVFEVWQDSHGYAGVVPKRGASNNRTVGANGEVDYWDNHIRYTVSNDAQIVQEVITYSFKATGELVVNNTKNLVASVPGTNRTIEQERQNIANWYQYYRRRSFVAKAALAKVITENPNYQYGLGMIQYGLSVASNTTPSSLFIPIKGGGLIDQLFSYNWGDSRTDPAKIYNTPLREGLDSVGKYFKGTLSGKTSPITSKCQQNFAIVFTDGYWDSSKYLTLGDIDGDGKKGFVEAPSTGTTPVSTTLADVAKYYYDTDLSPLPDEVPVSTFDKNNKQHLVTFSIAFGLQGKLLAGTDGWPTPTLSESSDWGNPFTDKYIAEKIDDMWHAAYNSKGTFLSAKNPETVSKGLANILASIGGRSGGSASSVAFNTNTLTSNTAVYLAQFKGPETTNDLQPDWIGDLKSFSLNASTGEVSGQAWSAASKLLSQSDTSRKIFTYNRETNKGVAFQWAGLAENQKKDLLTNSDGSIDTDITKGQARLAYLRGNRSNEGKGNGFFRKRSQLLSDIVHSDPLFVGRPQASWPATAPFTSPTCPQTYSAFKTANTNRAKVVYAGTNDGMLHGFAASDSTGNGYGDGSELMAYIPNSLFSFGSAVTGLHYLTDPNYTHRYYVDLPATLGDVCIDTSVTTSKGSNQTWHSVLLGGLMAGGRSIFAIDITNPSSVSFSESNASKIALWEFDNTDDADMGYSYAKPTVAMMENGRWAAIFGNGYNATGAESTGNAALFILFLDGGLDGVWTKDEDYIKIAAPTSVDKVVGNDCINGASNCNGLSSPQVVDINRDYKMDRVYAGDIRGNLWAFDLSSSDTKKWKVAYTTKDNKPAPLFTASHHITPASATTGIVKTPVQQKLCAGLACVQQITSKPLVVANPLVSATQPNVLVFFGTGQYMVDGDLTSKDIQSFYGIWDHGVAELTPANLIEQTFLSGPFYNAGVENTNIRVLSSNPVNYDRDNKTTNQGWFVNLNFKLPDGTYNGERVVVDPDLRVVDNSNTQNNDLIFFNTWIPVASECSAGGSGFLMSIDMTTGGNPRNAVFDLNGSNGVNDNDKVTKDGVAMGVSGVAFSKGLPSSSTFLDNRRYTPGTDGGDKITTDQVITGPPMRRISWQELRSN